MGSNQKIKLVQIIADCELGGGPRHVLDLLTHIDKQKFECFLICPKGNLAQESGKFQGTETINITMDSKFSLGAVKKIRSELNRIQSSHDPFGPMIVHTHGPRAGLLGRWATPNGIYSVYTEHIWNADYHLKNRFSEWLQLSLLRRLNRRTNLIIAVSNSVRDFLITHKLASSNRIKVIPNGINLEKLKVGGNNNIIGTVGNLNYQKGQKYLIEAIPEVIKHFPHAMLEIIGEGEERKNLELKIQNLKLQNHITLWGRQTNPQQFMRKWRIFAMPSLGETFGIAALEAMNIGLPVVASRVGGLSDLIQHNKNGLLVEKQNPQQLAENIIKLLNRPALYEKFRRQGYETAQKYSWNKIIRLIEREYLAIINYKT